MTEHQLQIITEVQNVVTDIIQHEVSPYFVFHNIYHTKDVASSVEKLAGYHQLCDVDEFILFVSAWFHDTGFSMGRVEGHEKESIKLATQFLNQHKANTEIINRVSACILATSMPQAPKHILEQIICDADLYHLGTDAYLEWSNLLKQELVNYSKNDISDEKWRQENIGFLRGHRFCTAHAQQNLEPVKQGWIKHLELIVTV